MKSSRLARTLFFRTTDSPNFRHTLARCCRNSAAGNVFRSRIEWASTAPVRTLRSYPNTWHSGCIGPSGSNVYLRAGMTSCDRPISKAFSLWYVTSSVLTALDASRELAGFREARGITTRRLTSETRCFPRAFNTPSTKLRVFVQMNRWESFGVGATPRQTHSPMTVCFTLEGSA